MSNEWKEFLRSVKALSGRKRHEQAKQDKKPEVNKSFNEFYQASLQNVELEINAKLKDDSAAEGEMYPSYLNESDFSRIDGSHIKKLRSGDLKIDARIDLHGMRLEEAEREFLNFLKESIELKLRYLLVITGKGRSSEGGVSVIKQSVPKWLNHQLFLGKILAYTFAHKKHGGEGAYYILLKK